MARWRWTPADPARAQLRSRDGPPAVTDAVRTNYRPTGRRQRVVLVFDTGAITRGLLEALRAEGLAYFYLDYAQLMERGTVSLGVAHGEPAELALGPARLRLRDVAAVVWNPPLHPASLSRRRPIAGHLYVQRWKQVLLQVRGLLPENVLWLPSHPLNGSNDWQEKLSELAIAERLGVRVPATICTNDTNAARAFVRRFRGRVLCKELSHTAVSLRPAFVRVGDPLRGLGHAPVGFQRYVDKAYDVRAVVVGRRIFACRIDSQASPRARVDWRVYDNANVRWELMRLPAALERRMRAMMRELDIGWGSFDLVRGKDGHFYFLEVNRPGASYWLLPFVGLDVPREVARFIRRRLQRSS